MLQKHENSALGVARVVVIGGEPAAAGSFLKSWLGGVPSFDPDGATAETAGGSVSFWSEEAACRHFGEDPVFAAAPGVRFGAVVFAVDNLDAAKLALSSGNVPHRHEGKRLVVPSEAAFGVLLAFEESTGPA